MILVKTKSGFICNAVPDILPLNGLSMCTAWIDPKTSIRIDATHWMHLPADHVQEEK